jgi:hypothetical protein
MVAVTVGTRPDRRVRRRPAEPCCHSIDQSAGDSRRPQVDRALLLVAQGDIQLMHTTSCSMQGFESPKRCAGSLSRWKMMTRIVGCAASAVDAALVEVGSEVGELGEPVRIFHFLASLGKCLKTSNDTLGSAGRSI